MTAQRAATKGNGPEKTPRKGPKATDEPLPPTVSRLGAVAAAVLLAAFAAAGCSGQDEPAEPVLTGLEAKVMQLKAMVARSPHAITPHTPELRAYRRHYGLDFPQARYDFEAMAINSHTIAVQRFEPPEPKATILIAHGYLDHGGLWRHAIRDFLASAYAVVVFDFPGHGLSTGKPAAIDDFATYLKIVTKVDARARASMPQPVHLVGHSMGGGIVTEHILRNGLEAPRRAALIAPNIRSNHWLLSRMGNALAGPFLATAPRMNRDVSHDEAFLAFRADRDPLQADRTPLDWFDELVAWEQRMQTLPPRPADVRIIQGRDDQITDWGYNVAFLRRKIPGVDVVMIEGGKHQLINEKPSLREQTFQRLREHLAAPD